MNKQKGLTPILLILIATAIGLTAGIGGRFYYLNKIVKGSAVQDSINQQVACTQEAKICPDGSSVGRTGPNCEFAACPKTNSDEIADWKTYRNEEYGFEIKYPVIEGTRVIENIAKAGKFKDKIYNTEISTLSSGQSFSKIQEGGFQISLGVGDYKFKPCIYTDEYTKLIGEIEKLNVQSIEFEKARTKQEGREGYNIQFCGVKNDITYHVNLFDYNSFHNQQSSLIDQMLSTFKFIEVDETANWQTYRNEKNGFEIKIPSSWTKDMKMMNENNSGHFDGWFLENSVKGSGALRIKINLFAELTPLLPNQSASNWIRSTAEIKLFNSKTKEVIISTQDSKETSIFSNFCLNKELDLKDSQPDLNASEATKYCPQNYDFYDFNLYCKNQDWQKCKELFNQILSTFRFSE